jgi:hypothetical protein
MITDFVLSIRKGLPDYCQASQDYSRRQRLFIYEPATPAVMKTVTDHPFLDVLHLPIQ